MKVITLRGKPNSGKTWTLRKVHELMLEKDFKQVPEMYKDLGNDDFLDILVSHEYHASPTTICFVGA